MKKQVTFAQHQKAQKSHYIDGLPSINQKSDSRTGFSNEANINQLLTSCEAKGHTTVIRIPKMITAAPFLQHTTLTPAQREYLYAIAASNRPAHVRKLITQHYMNVLHRCVPSGNNRVENHQNGTSPHLDAGHHSVHLEDNFRSKKRTGFQSTSKYSLPRIPHRPTSMSASKQRGSKKYVASLTSRSPKRHHRSQEENMEDFLSLSSLCVEDEQQKQQTR
ncbi:protein FAM216A [Synchiropus picturatus]